MVIWLASMPTFASNCESLPYLINDARSQLRHAASETLFEQARQQARWAGSILLDTAQAAQDCGCRAAYSEFNNAASRLSRARDAYNPSQVTDGLNSAISAFNAGLDALNVCRNAKSSADRDPDLKDYSNLKAPAQ